MKTMILAAALAGTALATPALAQTVTNGSFETPTVNGVSYSDGGDTALTGGAGYEANGGAFGYANAVDGNQILHLQGTGTATLSVNDLLAGSLYTLSFFAAARPGYGALPVSVSFGDTLLGQFTPTSNDFTQFTDFNFLATGTTGSITFAGLNDDSTLDLNTGIDAVSVSAAVPEPATWAMMIVGFGLAGYAMRRRTRATVAFA